MFLAILETLFALLISVINVVVCVMGIRNSIKKNAWIFLSTANIVTTVWNIYVLMILFKVTDLMLLKSMRPLFVFSQLTAMLMGSIGLILMAKTTRHIGSKAHIQQPQK